ncbi:MAG: ComF family protein [Candidatus Saccharimonadales bacterium]
MISAYKYDSIRAYGKIFAELLDACLPKLPDNTIVVPMPTIKKHVRERGIDHTLLIAKKLCHLRHLPYRYLIGRASNAVQVGASREDRLAQAQVAYRLNAPPGRDVSYLILDDVWTTGASLRAACQLLKENGAHHLMVAVLARSTK